MVATLVLTVLLGGCAAVAFYCKRSLVREARGQEIHAHSDGTVHEHHRGAVPHTHPTFVERYDGWLTGLLPAGAVARARAESPQFRADSPEPEDDGPRSRT